MDNPKSHQSSSFSEEQDWFKQMRDQISLLYKVPLKQEYSRDVFKWVSTCCFTGNDCEWMTLGKNWDKQSIEMFSTIARISINEISLILPFIKRHITNDEPVKEEGKVLERSAIFEDYENFDTHLVIIESVIKSLVKHDNETSDLIKNIGTDNLYSLLERLKELVSELLEYVEEAYNHWNTISSNEKMVQQFEAAQGGLRIISVWFSECPESFEPQCKRFLIDLLIQALMDCKNLNLDLLMLALHSISCQNKDLLRHLRSRKHHREALEVYLRHIEHEDIKKHSSQAESYKLRYGMVKDILFCELNND